MAPLSLSLSIPSRTLTPAKPSSLLPFCFRPFSFFRILKPRPYAATGSIRCRPLIFSLAKDTSSSTIHFEYLTEKDWSFLDPDPSTSEQEHDKKATRAIAAAEVGEKSRVLVSFGSELFVDQLADAPPCELLLVVHDSLFSLAMIKEKHDRVRCWQGPIVDVPETFSPFDVVFLSYLPAIGFPLGELFKSLAGRCSQGARVVINCAHGRDVVESVHRKKYPDVVTSTLPDKVTLESAASEFAFELTQFMDEPTFYLAVLKFNGSNSD